MRQAHARDPDRRATTWRRRDDAHLTQYDTAHGKFPGEVGVDGGDLIVSGDRVKVLAERDPSKLPWGALGVDVVHESTGLFTSKAKAGAHIAGGAKKVIISAPGEKDVDGTFVMGVNEDKLTAQHQVTSNASCTTNCLAPLAKVLHEKIGIVHGLMTTIHSYTNDQVLTDGSTRTQRRAQRR
jgi:glyceraldehyde 3-phosphate dehydrogenase